MKTSLSTFLCLSDMDCLLPKRWQLTTWHIYPWMNWKAWILLLVSPLVRCLTFWRDVWRCSKVEASPLGMLQWPWVASCQFQFLVQLYMYLVNHYPSWKHKIRVQLLSIIKMVHANYIRQIRRIGGYCGFVPKLPPPATHRNSVNAITEKMMDCSEIWRTHW